MEIEALIWLTNFRVISRQYLSTRRSHPVYFPIYLTKTLLHVIINQGLVAHTIINSLFFIGCYVRSSSNYIHRYTNEIKKRHKHFS